MRISTATFFSTSLFGVREQQNAIARLNQQLASNQRLLAPKDDPVAISQVLRLTESIASRTQALSNQQKADLAVKHESAVLSELHDSLSEVRNLIGDAPGVNDHMLRDQVATSLAGFHQHIISLLNTRDANGDYVFAGFETGTQPYTHTQAFNPASPGGPADSPDSSYAGDAGQRRIEIENGRFIAVNDDLNPILQAGGAADILELIDQVAIDLHDATITPAALQASLSNAYSLLNTAIDGVTTVLTAVAGRQVEVANVKENTEQLLLLDRNALGELTDLDQAAAIVELQQRQISLQAAESAFSLTANLSLFNFLS